MQVLSKVTEKPYEELKKIIAEDPEEMGDATRLEKVNKKLERKKPICLCEKEIPLFTLVQTVGKQNM